MKYRRLGKTDLKVSEIGIGGMGITEKYGTLGEQEFIRMVRRGFDLGINFIDTAPCYEESEEVFGKALEGYRDKWFVTTKVGPCCFGIQPDEFSKNAVLYRFDKSLRRLKTEYVDLVLIHDIQNIGAGKKGLEAVLKKGGALDGLRQLQKEEKIRYVGVSGRVAELIEAIKTDEFDAVLTFNTYNLLNQSAGEELIPLAKRHDVGVIVGGPFYQGLLSKDPTKIIEKKDSFFWKWDEAYYKTEELMEKLHRIKSLVKDEKELRETALRFILSNPNISVVVSGVKAVKEIEENARASDADVFSSEELRKIVAT